MKNKHGYFSLLLFVFTLMLAGTAGASKPARPLNLEVEHFQWQGYVSGNWASVTCPHGLKLVGCSSHCGNWGAGGDYMNGQQCMGGCATANSIIVVAACARVY